MKGKIFNSQIEEIFYALDQELRLQKIVSKRESNKTPKNDLETMSIFAAKALSLKLVIIEEKLKLLKNKYER